jgi:8-oxo-dGTP pyrophosphatase MutT (NUDIX family)
LSETRAQFITDRLTSTARDRSNPNVRPRDAATLILLDRSESAPKVLMGRRHPGHKFMPGMFVFPGGRIESGDRAMPVSGVLSTRAEQALLARVTRPSPSRCRALALAAIRETYEETGLLLGTKELGAPEAVPVGPWSAFQEHGVFPEIEDLQVIARAITPPRRPKRFDTRFFAIDRTAVAHEVGGVVGPTSELVELAWVTLSDARKLQLPVITLTVLEDLEERLANGFKPELPVPFYYERRGRFVRELL